MNLMYILDHDHNPVPVADAIEWSVFFENIDNRRVAYDTVNGINVSTVFLGVDHSFTDDGPPILFETMCFGGPDWLDEFQRRYATWDEAEQGHRATVAAIRENRDIEDATIIDGNARPASALLE